MAAEEQRRKQAEIDALKAKHDEEELRKKAEQDRARAEEIERKDRSDV